jgi:hypothetical protein
MPNRQIDKIKMEKKAFVFMPVRVCAVIVLLQPRISQEVQEVDQINPFSPR